VRCCSLGSWKHLEMAGRTVRDAYSGHIK
jgi:hypothetical protein